MQTKLFELIYNSLFDKYTECETRLSHIHSRKDFESMVLSDLMELKEWANSALADMTTIVMVDFYHIVGMGNLTVIQSSKLVSLMRKYLNYRTVLKTIASHFNSFEDIPEIPTGSKYVLQKVAKGIELHGGEGEEFEERASLIDLSGKRRKEMPKSCCFRLEGNVIFLNDDQKRDFFNGFNKLGCGTAGKFETFERKLNNHCSYLGIDWETNREGVYIGKITSVKVCQKIREWAESGKDEEVK